MKLLRVQNQDDYPASLKGGVVAIGNFDGVHRGHQAVLCQAVNLARSHGVPAIVLTFEPHPRSFFRPQAPVFRLTRAATKARLLEAIGFDCVFEHSFDEKLSSTHASDFVRDLLVETLGVSHVVTGYDFHFGKNRQGSPQFLMEAGERHGFSATIVKAFSDEGGQVISSSRIRACLASGDLAQANALLGYSFRVTEKVIKGQQIGRTMGYPTANLSLPGEARLEHGIYAVRVGLEDSNPHPLYPGVASYGRRPTFDNGAALLEAFIFDFSGDLYGQDITVYLESRLRGEETFASVEELVKQMDIDSEQAKHFLAAMQPGQGLWPVVTC